MHFLLAISQNPVNKKYEKDLVESEECLVEEEDWHAILVADFEYSDVSDEDWSSSGDELISDDDEAFSYNAPVKVIAKKDEMTIAEVPNYSDICSTLVKQYWRNYSEQINLTELQVIREIVNMLQGAPTSHVFEYVVDQDIRLRENISLQHYSNDALYSALEYFRDKISMVQSLHALCDDVSSCIAQPSHPYGSRTFQAFTCALVMYLEQLTESLSHIEIKVKAQKEVVTLTVLREAVREHFEIVTALYEMVQEILLTTEISSPSVCVTKLINTLFDALQLYESMGLLTQHITKVLLTILLCTIQPVLSTIDQWLAHGDLNNSTGELFLCRDPEIECNSREYWDAGLTFKLRGRDKTEQVPGILLAVCEKMLKAGKAIELIKNLGKLGVPDANIFHVLLTKYLGNYVVEKEPEKAVVLSSTACGMAVVDHLMMSMFQDIQAPETPKPPIYCKIWQSIDKLHIIPSTSILKILVPLMEDRCSQVSFNLLTTLRSHFSLDAHLDTLRRAMLMEAGLNMSTFCNEMYRDVYAGEKIRIMNAFLRECLHSQTPFTSILRMEVTNPQNSSSSCAEIDIFQTVTLIYNPPFPVDVVLDENLLHIYQNVFRLLLQINYAAWCIQPLSLMSFHDSPVSTAVHCFRYRLTNFIQLLQAYTMQRVLHCTGAEMRQELDKANELDQYAEIHRKYCLQMEEFCLLTGEFRTMLSAIRHALNEAVKFRRLWDMGEVGSDKMDKIIKEVNKCIAFVTNLVKKRNQVSNFPQPHFDWLETCLA